MKKCAAVKPCIPVRVMRTFADTTKTWNLPGDDLILSWLCCYVGSIDDESAHRCEQFSVAPRNPEGQFADLLNRQEVGVWMNHDINPEVVPGLEQCDSVLTGLYPPCGGTAPGRMFTPSCSECRRKASLAYAQSVLEKYRSHDL